MTKIIISLFCAVLILQGIAALVTYFAVGSGRFVEGNPTTAELQINYGLANGLMLTLFQGALITLVPLTTFLVTIRFARSKSVRRYEKESMMSAVKYLFFPITLSVLIFLTLLACADVTHDLAMLISNGKINLWGF
jgi:hypothetical protein